MFLRLSPCSRGHKAGTGGDDPEECLCIPEADAVTMEVEGPAQLYRGLPPRPNTVPDLLAHQSEMLNAFVRGKCVGELLTKTPDRKRRRVFALLS